MLKKWSNAVLLTATVLVLAVLGACSDGGSGGGGGGISGGGGSVVARSGSEVEGAELTFYSDSRFVFKQGGSRAVSAVRALSESVTGTYSGNPATGEGLVCAPSSGAKTFVVTIKGSNAKITLDGIKYNLVGVRDIVSAWSRSENGTTDTLYFHNDGTFVMLSETGKIVGGGSISYDGDASKDGDLRVILSENHDYMDNVTYEMATLKISGDTLTVYNSDNEPVQTYKKTTASKKIDSAWRCLMKDDAPPYHDSVVTLYLYSDGIYLLDFMDPEAEDIFDDYGGVLGPYTKNGNALVLHYWIPKDEYFDAAVLYGEDIPIDEEHYHDEPMNATISGNTVIVSVYDDEEEEWGYVVLEKIK